MSKSTWFRERIQSVRQSGFTLVELVITMLIIGILAAVAAPKFSDSVNHFRADAAAKRVAADLRLAQREAEATSASQTIQFNVPALDRYTLVGMQDINHSNQTYQVDLAGPPYSSSIASVNFGGDSELVFDGFGAPDSGGTIVVQSGIYQQSVLVDAATGRVSIQ